ncbi:DUF814 domain-containing protein [Candidatus Micrarchaeota archaeon]|nr:DUF814 domain-containing protein [Candidatus Micrarchaeota archaeon]
MKITLDPNRSAYENISAYYEEAKKWRRKAEGVRNAMKQTENKPLAKEAKPTKKTETKTKWYGEYHSAFTKNGLLVVSGKSAKQNDELVAKHLKAGDLFFHADVVGASATILKTGGKPPKNEDLDQAAQMAASYSRAWKQSWHAVDVYCVPPEQLSKYSQGEFVGKGAFIVSGQRQWFRNTPLKLYIREKEGYVVVTPEVHSQKPEGAVLIAPGSMQKEQAAKQLAKRFRVREEELLSVLPGDVEVG